MPKNRVQGTVFGILMSYVMAYGMEIYNVGVKYGVNLQRGGFSNMPGHIFLDALTEASYMGIFVIILSTLYGNKAGAAFAAKYTDPEKDNPYFCRILRQAGTVAVMCPSMSFVATVIFNIIMGGAPLSSLPAVFIGTVIKNFPVAFFWNMFAAAPFCHFVFDKYNESKLMRAKDRTGIMSGAGARNE
ncbi:MAG: hypothetical protein PUA82_00020 [Eubacteriales bacterium]|nr:hypothetical protein [Eubacteriales bacterium]